MATEQLQLVDLRVLVGEGELRKLQQLARKRGISVDEAASEVLERFFISRLQPIVPPARRKS